MAEFIGICSYKGVEWFPTNMPTTGGIAYSKKKFINSNRQSIDELGENPNSYSISGYIALVGDEENYRAKRDRLLTALNSKGNGVLNHPTFGVLENIKAVSWDLDETVTEIGIGSISIDFEVNNSDGNLVFEVVTIGSIGAENKNLRASIADNISENVSIKENLLGVYNANKSKVESIGRAFKASTDFSERLTDEIDTVGIEIAKFQDAAVFLASKPTDLGLSIANVFKTISGTFTSAESAYESYKTFFNFGFITDVDFSIETEASKAKKKNNRILNQSINSLALGEAYLSASSIEFKTVGEIDLVFDELESQFQSILDSGDIEYKVINDLVEIRTSIISLFEIKKLNASRIITVHSELTTARAISFSYYGDDSNAEDIANINSSNGISMSGDIKVFSA